MRIAAPSGSLVYFIEGVGVDRVKIGTSTDVETRITDLLCGSPVPLSLLFVIPGGPDEEKELHHRFRHAHSHGEWFTLSAIEDELNAIDDAQGVTVERAHRCLKCGRVRKRKWAKASGLCRGCSAASRGLNVQKLCVICAAPNSRAYSHNEKERYCTQHREEEKAKRAAVRYARVSELMRGNQNASVRRRA